jgi:dimethylamine/trimethylamine dehydrogenase
LGGRVLRESALPGLQEYIRVRDYRAQQILQMPNVEVFYESHLSAEDVHAVEADHVVIATGARWRSERFNGSQYVSVAAQGTTPKILTADDIMEGITPDGPTLIYDEDGYYLAGVIAEKVRIAGHRVIYATPADAVSQWAENTSERWRVRSHMMQLGIEIEVSKSLQSFDGSTAQIACTYSDQISNIGVQNLVMVTQRKPNDSLYHTLRQDAATLSFTLTRIGDCDAPAIIAAAVYAGHTYARTLDAPVDLDDPLRHDRVDVGQTPEGAHLGG